MSQTYLICDKPLIHSNVSANFTLEISFDKSNFYASNYILRISNALGYPSINSIVWKFVHSTTVTEITLNGNGFTQSTNCMFKWIPFVNAETVITTTITMLTNNTCKCNAPLFSEFRDSINIQPTQQILLPQKVFVSINDINNDYQIDSSVWIEYYGNPYIEDIIPRLIIADQSTNITVLGNGFAYHEIIYCHFYDENQILFYAANVTFISEAMVTCNAAVQNPRKNVTFKISYRNILFFDNENIPINIVARPHISHLESHTIDRHMGDNITIFGSNFDIASFYLTMCYFYDGSSELKSFVYLINSTCMTCYVPYMSSPNAIVTIKFGNDVYTNTFNVTIFETLEIHDYYPTHIEIYNAFAVTIIGTNFNATQTIQCKLETDITYAVVTNDTSIVCTFTNLTVFTNAYILLSSNNGISWCCEGKQIFLLCYFSCIFMNVN